MKHLKSYQLTHYQTADKRIKQAAKFAKRMWIAQQNSEYLGVTNPKGYIIRTQVFTFTVTPSSVVV